MRAAVMRGRWREVVMYVVDRYSGGYQARGADLWLDVDLPEGYDDCAVSPVLLHGAEWQVVAVCWSSKRCVTPALCIGAEAHEDST